MNPTPYSDVNTVLQALRRGIERIFGDNLIGLYLTGSLSYGDFNPASSDIDLVAILNAPASHKEVDQLTALHAAVARNHPTWATRVEVSYTPVEMLSSILPPEMPRPYYGEGVFYHEAGYGNEWIINLYLQMKYAVTLVGPEFTMLVEPVDMTEVQKACIRDLFREWEPKINDFEWLSNSHYQSYLVLNLCRILYTVMNHAAGSKPVSAAWVKSQYPQWAALIETAEGWRYGTEMHLANETSAFVQFAIDQVKATTLYRQMNAG